jgi:macrolide transport system ATP-binding/permease protein
MRAATLLQIKQLSKSYGVKTILAQVNLTISTGECVGLVGANGVGKSTLLNILTGALAADAGTCVWGAGVRLGYLTQTIDDRHGRTIADAIATAAAALHDAECAMRRLEGQMSEADPDALGEILRAYESAQADFERCGGYDFDARVAETFQALGLNTIAQDRPLASLSGGEKARVALACLLLGAADVLLLDEPTNHLDARAQAWLVARLKAHQRYGAVLVASHDRYFLNQVCDAIAEIEEHNHTLKHYHGDYDAYRHAKDLARVQWEQTYQQQQAEMSTLRRAVHVDARASSYRTPSDNDKFMLGLMRDTHAQTVSRKLTNARAKLERLEQEAVERPPRPLRFMPRFDVQTLGKQMPLSLANVWHAFGERLILCNISLQLTARSRIVLVGPNGAGKTTLLQILAGVLKPDSGQRFVERSVELGYLPQEDHFAPDDTVWEAFRAGLAGSEQELTRHLLATFLFHHADLQRRISEASVGQRRKIQLARLIATQANVLLLDEPTNHISFDVLESFEDALDDFPGPIIAATHDRRFIERFGGEVYAVDQGRLRQQNSVG